MRIFASLVFSALVLLAHTALAEGPAVTGPNGKLTAFGGLIAEAGADDSLGGLAGTYTLPLFYQYGIQIDGGYARVGHADFLSTGAHLFWRNPTVGMIGFYGGYARLHGDHNFVVGQDIGRVGVEAQHFAGRLTLDGAVGQLFSEQRDGVYGRARLNYYLTDNLMFSGGYAYEDRGFASFGTEIQIATTETTGVSLFTEGLVGDGDNYSVIGGVKLFFGKRMTSIDRHRRQDPESYTNSDLAATYQSVTRSNGQANICPLNAILPLTNSCACPTGAFRCNVLDPPRFQCSPTQCPGF